MPCNESQMRSGHASPRSSPRYRVHWAEEARRRSPRPPQAAGGRRSKARRMPRCYCASGRACPSAPTATSTPSCPVPAIPPPLLPCLAPLTLSVALLLSPRQLFHQKGDRDVEKDLGFIVCPPSYPFPSLPPPPPASEGGAGLEVVREGVGCS